MDAMNGANGQGAAAPVWQEARSEAGRIYYFNTITKATQWAKPDELMTPAERALSNQPWKEYTADGGRKYWYNTETKQSSWDMPQAYKDALQEQKPSSPHASAPSIVAAGGFPHEQRERERDRERNFSETKLISYGDESMRANLFVPSSTDPEYSTFAEAEAAFMKLLRRSNVQTDWTWDQTMRHVIKDPQYRALKDPKDRRTTFEKWVVETRLEERDREKTRLTKLRTAFAKMLKSHPEIKHYTRWKTAKPIMQGEAIFRSAKDDDERRQLFEDYILELKKAHMEREAVKRKAAMDELVEIINSLNLEAYTQWSDAQSAIQSDSRFQDDAKFKVLSKSDVLTVFENHIKYLERTSNDVRQEQKNQKVRRERQRRDGFIALLQELRAGGKINAGSKWSQIYPLVENDERYTAMLGQPGSTPIELFWDIVEEEERGLRSTRNTILDVLDDRRFEVQQKTNVDDFLAIVQKDGRTADIDRDTLVLVFDRLKDKASRRSDDDKHQAERQQRRAVDGLRSYLRHLDPPLRPDDTYEKIQPLMEKSEDYQALTDELRRSAFDKAIRRLKEKDDDDRDRLKRRDRSSMERFRDRDRADRTDRAYRGRHARPSRTPEPDIYEADRRKAIADREKNYRKTSAADTLLSPGRRGSDLRDRDRDYDRPPPRRRSIDRYDRRDRDRDAHDDRERDRDRYYRRRADPRHPVDELPYGDERPTRRRRPESDNESAASSRRDAKRPRRDRSRERSPAPRPDRRHRSRTPPVAAAATAAAAPAVPKEDPAVHSGSEEGEIEED